jgi:sodium-dependent dicarboxylate transporter 2/3/5
MRMRIIGGGLAAVVAFALPLVFPPADLGTAGTRMLAIFLAAIVLWVTEAIPLHATAMLIILLEVLMISSKALGAPLPEAPSPTVFYGALADPVIILFLGGFMIALGAEKFTLDRNLAALALGPIGGHSRRTLLVLMGLTAGLSMFVSNTATAATMFAVLVPVLRQAPPGKVRTGLALSIPIAANIGGLATPVGSPPNAIAVAALANAGHPVTFAQWLLFGFPLMLILLLFAWLMLSWLFIPTDVRIEFDLKANFDRSPKAGYFYVIAALTVLGWLLESVHGISAATVGFFAVVALLAGRAISSVDLGQLPWAVLWLVSGGIALGTGLGSAGVDDWIVGLVDWAAVPEGLLVLGLAVLALVLSTFISNSATANLLIPIGLTVATAAGGNPMVAGIGIALACSLAMALPISTPPNAVAYATGEVSTKNMALTGAIIGLVGIPLLVVLVPWIVSMTH